MRPHTHDRAIEWFIPRPEFRERHALDVNAPADLVFEASEQFELTSVPAVRAILRLREWLMGAHEAPRRDRGHSERGQQRRPGVEDWRVAIVQPAPPDERDQSFVAVRQLDGPELVEPRSLQQGIH